MVPNDRHTSSGKGEEGRGEARAADHMQDLGRGRRETSRISPPTILVRPPPALGRHIYHVGCGGYFNARCCHVLLLLLLRDLRWPDPFPPRSVLAAAETDFSPSFVKEPEEEGGGGGMEVPASYVPLPRLSPPFPWLALPASFIRLGHLASSLDPLLRSPPLAASAAAAFPPSFFFGLASSASVIRLSNVDEEGFKIHLGSHHRRSVCE